MAAKKKEKLAQEETLLIQDVETPLAEPAGVGPPDEDAGDGPADAHILAAEDAEEEVPGPVAGSADDENSTGTESTLDIFVEEPSAVEEDVGTAEAETPPGAPDADASTAEDAEKDAPMKKAVAEDTPPAEPSVPATPKRASRKSKAASEPARIEDSSPSDSPLEPDAPLLDERPDAPLLGEEPTASPKAPLSDSEAGPETATPASPPSAAVLRKHTAAAPRSRPAQPAILTIENGDLVETQADREDMIWHEIHNAYRVRRVLTGQFCGVEQSENGKTLAIADYKGFRVVIPLREMLMDLGDRLTGKEYRDEMQRLNRLLGNMLGAKIDFVVRGIDSGERRAVASRRDAMLRKRQTFYFGTDADGMYRIHEGRIVQARVVAVAEKVIRVEAFGVECSIPARDLAWDWIGDAHERYAVGDRILVRIQSVQRDSLEDVRIRADVRSLNPDAGRAALDKCQLQSKYIGRITDVRKGGVFIRLTNGANAVAHSCFDYRIPGKQDDVSFVVTAIDEERGVATGIITRIIRQNL